MDTEAYRFVIVGAGLAGAATAHHLRRRGVVDLLLLEKEHVPGVHASGRNAAMIRERVEETELQDVATEGAVAARSGELASFRPTGGLLLGWGDDAACDWIPWMRGRALFCPDDGIIDVAALLQGYLRGCSVRYGCQLLRYTSSEEGVAIETSAGRLHADVLVNAAGAWAGRVGRLPLQPLNRTIYVSRPDDAVDPTWPFAWDLQGGYYLRPESGGLLLSACDEARADPGEYREDPAVLLDLLQKLAVHQPGLAEPVIAHHWVGQRTFAPDRLPVLGFDPREPRLFHVAALGGHGVTVSHAVGDRAARMLLGEQDGDVLFAPARIL